MSHAGVQASRALVESAVRIFTRLTPEEWEQPSACAGWRVQDVIVHMGVFFNLIADPSSLDRPPNPSGKVERMNDIMVNQRRHWSSAQALEYYEQQANAALPRLDAVQEPPLADTLAGGADIGYYPLHARSDAVAFDHLIHLTIDLPEPNNPAEGPGIKIDEAYIAPALDWMLTGLPAMCGTDIGPALTRPVEISLEGPGARRFLLVPTADEATPIRIHPATGKQAPDCATSTTQDFLAWATRRQPWWRFPVRITGERLYVADVLSRIDII
ncbi:maleylpyruvate isomerase N-terminal domain-containing protein [Streptomyces sp. NPDC050145]|uniref:maleylpyruvate isomerase N-terminal domain-containing protein n=1 Tax=Streptomyces sp. NPDC050145 TaxID=3365602 RepID=UPI00379B2E9B